MPWEPRRHDPEERAIELNAQILQRHDPAEINARIQFDNMRFRRVAIILMSWCAAVAAYYGVPTVLQPTNWPMIWSICWAFAWVVGHIAAVVGAICLFAYLLCGGRFFEELDA